MASEAYAAQRAQVSGLLHTFGVLLSDLLDRSLSSSEAEADDTARLLIDKELQHFWQVTMHTNEHLGGFV